MAAPAGKKFYNAYRKGHGKVLVPTSFPALVDDTFEYLPEWEALSDAEKKGWAAVAKAKK